MRAPGNILALDIAACTGWALDADDIDASDNPQFGSVKFPGSLGFRLLALEGWLTRFMTDRKVRTLAVEMPIPAMGNTTMENQLWAYGAHAIVRKVAAHKRVPVMVVAVQTWRVFFCGYAKAPFKNPDTGEIMAGRENANKRRKWIKDKTIAACRAKGWDPQDDNAADALGLLGYCLACFDPRNDLVDPSTYYAEAA
jgi:hypothetical protein